MAWKIQNLQNTRNSLVDFDKYELPDPVDYGYDLDIGFTDYLKKDEWCNTVREKTGELYELLTAQRNSLYLINEESDLPITVQEDIAENTIIKDKMYTKWGQLEKIIVDFNC